MIASPVPLFLAGVADSGKRAGHPAVRASSSFRGTLQESRHRHVAPHGPKCTPECRWVAPPVRWRTGSLSSFMILNRPQQLFNPLKSILGVLELHCFLLLDQHWNIQ